MHGIGASLFGILLLQTSLTSAAPLSKRIAQVIVDATHDWEQACLVAGGAEQCNPLSIAAFSTLLAAPGPCEQQNAADNMIDLAHKLGNNSEVIRLTQLFRQQPRNAPDSLSVLYCQTAPRNGELKGLFQCQFAGVNPTTFTGGLKVGAAGTIPFGLTSAVSPPSSCPASSKPVPDGQQLNKLVKSPGVAGAAAPPPAASPPKATPPTAKTKTKHHKSTAKGAATAAAPPPAAVTSGASNVPFAVLNGQDAQALNAKFATLTPNSPCQAGENACVKGGFAQCVGGKFVVTGCAAGTQCFGLPLVNSRGTSIACTTSADAQARLSAALGTAVPLPAAKPAAVPAPAPVAAPASPAQAPAAPAPASNNKPFALSNGKAAQALNKKFVTLSTSSPCAAGENACVKGGFAQCVGGSFVVTGCAGGLQCFGLPLVNSAGTSITCTTAADAAARIAATGASGGITGA